MAEISAGWISIVGSFVRIPLSHRLGEGAYFIPALAYARAFVIQNDPPDRFVRRR
jgi:hypothetical protein